MIALRRIDINSAPFTPPGNTLRNRCAPPLITAIFQHKYNKKKKKKKIFPSADLVVDGYAALSRVNDDDSVTCQICLLPIRLRRDPAAAVMNETLTESPNITVHCIQVESNKQPVDGEDPDKRLCYTELTGPDQRGSGGETRKQSTERERCNGQDTSAPIEIPTQTETLRRVVSATEQPYTPTHTHTHTHALTQGTD